MPRSGLTSRTRPRIGVVVDDDGDGASRAARHGADGGRDAASTSWPRGHAPDVAGVARSTPTGDGGRRCRRRLRASPRVCTPGAAAVAAEAWVGAARGARARRVPARSAIDVFAGILLDGEPWRGAHGRAGAAAWLALNPVERQDYRKLGSLAAEVSRAGIARRLSWRIKAGDRSRVLERAGGSLDAITGGARLRRRARRRRRRDLGRPRHREVHRHGGREPRRAASIPKSSCSAAASPARAICCSSRSARSARAGCRPSDARALRVEFSTLGDRRASPSARRGSRCVARRMIVLSGADVVLPDRMLGGRHARPRRRSHRRYRAGPARRRGGARRTSTFRDHYIVPGFIDVHVHGVEGIDTLDGGDGDRGDGASGCRATASPRSARRRSRARRRRCGAMLAGVRARAHDAPAPRGARVLPAHLESNFINPDYKGAQPLECLRLAAAARARGAKAELHRRATSSPRSPPRGPTSASSRSRRSSTAGSI